MTRVVVAGAGIAGLTCALAFAERRCEVAVYERATTLGATACSRFAGGMLAPWCELETAEPLVAALGAEAIPYWQEHHPETRQHGSLVLAQGRDLPELDRFARRTHHYDWVEGDHLAVLEPALAGRFRKGLFFAEEAHLDPRRALPGLAEKLTELGATIHLGIDALPHQADADIFVDCRGLAARDRMPALRGVKGEMLLVHAPEITLSRPVRLLHPRIPLYIVPRGNGFCMIGATMIESEDRRVTAQSLVDLLNGAYALHPAFAQAEVIEIGCDLRPSLPDNLPRLRRQGSAISVNGLYRHGFLLAPALAARAAAVMLDNAFFPEVMDEDHRQW